MILAAGAVLFVCITANAATDPKEAVTEFYTAHFKSFDVSGPGMRKKEKWLSKSFAAAVNAWLKPSKKKAADEPGIDGDIFTNAQDEPTAFDVGPAKISGEKASAPLTLYFGTPDKPRTGERTKGTVQLVLEDGSWKIDDIIIAGDDARKDLANEKK